MSSRAAAATRQYLSSRTHGAERGLTASADPLHRHARELLDELDIGLRPRRQVLPLLDRRGRLHPALKLLVHNLALLEVAEVGGEVVELGARLGVLIGDGNLDGRERVQYVKLCVVSACFPNTHSLQH